MTRKPLRLVTGLAVTASLGFGGPVYGDETVVVAFGTSLTARGTWTRELENALEPCFPEGVRIERVAGVGEDSEWALGEVDRVIAAKPDAVVIEFAINDADLSRRVSVSRSRANHEALIAALRAALPEVRIALATTNPSYGPRGWIRPFLDDYYQAYREIAEESGVTLIDVHRHWLAATEHASRRALLPDGLHPSDEANQMIHVPALEVGLKEIFAETGTTCP